MLSSRLNLAAISAALEHARTELPRADASFRTTRDPLDQDVIDNLVAGYSFVETLIANSVDIFSPGQSQQLLELNYLVLCGTDARRRAQFQSHLAATEGRFYSERDAGMGDLVKWWRTHASGSAWERAAGIYLYAFTQPQLLIEGNHRTGALLMSYLLMRDSHPPFVLTTANAGEFFACSAQARDLRKAGLRSIVRLAPLRKRFANVIENAADRRYLHDQLPVDNA